MILYHGSNLEVSRPDLLHSRKNVDFGPGFYTTPLRQQAEKWCLRFHRRGEPAVVSIYSLDETVLRNFSVKEFSAYDEEWLDFVLRCRSGRDDSDFDVVIGGVANDKVFNTVELYFDHLIDKAEALRRLKFEQPNLQVCIRNDAILNHYLHYEGSEML